MAGLALTAASIGLSIFGASRQYSASKAQNQAMQQQIEAERRAEELRRRQMELEARRRQREILRNQQRARAAALATVTAQGAAGGSGLQGSYSQIAGETGNMLLSTNQNLMIGQGLFDTNLDISAARSRYAEAGTQMSEGRMFSQLGSTLFSVTPQLTQMSKGFGTGSSNYNVYNQVNPWRSAFPTPY